MIFTYLLLLRLEGGGGQHPVVGFRNTRGQGPDFYCIVNAVDTDVVNNTVLTLRRAVSGPFNWR